MNTSTADVNLGIDLHLPMKLRPARTAVPENSVDANIDAKQQADSARPRTEILSDHVTAPRFGLSNPTKVDNPFWKSILIGKHLTSNTDRKCRAVVEANSLPTNLGSSKKDSATDTSSTPAPPQRFTINWCSSRSGQTRTRLPDGRSILIGGIHADSPHGKCVIFNDVTVLHDRPADDDQQFFPPPIKPEDIEVYTYPKAAFPPVYGHTATYVHTEGGHEQICRSLLLPLYVTCE
ncbi:hypothetical protein B0T17DRAFT_525357 [Bombardia bombarda]|uniref:Uncharacterized protein n=1 Tax=Bombardia bombarda TaxID=252184 RepID=A0AA39X8Y7_9PEZI|nr:hypothetical protein B0T17DRAFT_525357 [Bombardia bombarda]